MVLNPCVIEMDWHVSPDLMSYLVPLQPGRAGVVDAL